MTVDTIRKINEKHPINLYVDVVEDSAHYRNLLYQLLDLYGLHNRREFSTPEDYKQEIEDKPELIPHLALLDFRYDTSDLTGNDLTFMLMEKCKKKSFKTKAFMITGWDRPKDIRKFFHIGGFRWLDKYEKDFEDQFKESVMIAITEIQAALEDLAFYDELEEN